jgi:DNA adenine methylase
MNNIAHLSGSRQPAKLCARFGKTSSKRPHSLAYFLILFFLMVGPLSYIGGKNRVAKEIIGIFPAHTTYVEAFAGGAQVFFHKQPSEVEVLNDRYLEIVNFFRVCQWHPEELVRSLRFSLVSRDWFNLYAKQQPETLTDIQRAARFFYLQKNAFAGLVVNQNYHYSVTRPPNLNPATLPKLIEKVHERLQRVQIESLPYEEIIRRYDRPKTLFYLDPPYWNRKLYKFNFEEADFVKLEEWLRRIRGKFVLSLNDVPEVRKLFRRYSIRKIDVPYTAQMQPGKQYAEVLITNFALPSRS